MKKFIFLMFLLMTGLSVNAQKRYVTVYSYSTYGDAYLSGDIPTSMKASYNPSDFGYRDYNSGHGYDAPDKWIGLLLNMLSDEGFTIEQMNTTAYGSSSSTLVMTYLLSKPTGGKTSNSIQRVQIEDNSGIYEVARYNLQGLPVLSTEKGVQIIVYSNYTTKTIIVE